jgi:hypothetical protein
VTESELRAKYTQAVRIIRAERRMREHVFRNDPVKLNEKLVEIDMLLGILTELKDALKPHCEPGVEQMALLDAPVRYE